MLNPFAIRLRESDIYIIEHTLSENLSEVTFTILLPRQYLKRLKYNNKIDGRLFCKSTIKMNMFSGMLDVFTKETSVLTLTEKGGSVRLQAKKILDSEERHLINAEISLYILSKISK